MPLDASESDSYLRGIGRFIVHWGHAEAGLDIANLVILHNGGKAIDRQLPRSLDRKLSFFRKAHTKVEKYKLFAARALPLAQSLADVREFRHNITHGVHWGYLSEDVEKLVIRFQYTPDNIYGTYQVKYSAREIWEKAITLNSPAKNCSVTH